jgi:hypothetical protein
VRTTFNVLQTITKQQQSLFNTSRVAATQQSLFNVRKTLHKTAPSYYDVYLLVSQSVTMEWNVGQAVQFGMRLAGRDRWISMYPGGY